VGTYWLSRPLVIPKFCPLKAWHGAKVSDPWSACHEPNIRSADERAKSAAGGRLLFVVLVKRVVIELVLLRVYY
jgi:hypothetical protein